MRRLVVVVVPLVLAFAFATVSPAVAAGKAKAAKLKEGWTEEKVKSASDDCTEALVQGMWENTKKDQGVEGPKPLTDAIRKELEPQIAPMRRLCACAVREGAKRYTYAEAEAGPADLERAVAESISDGTCKVE
jgi:hypothetical protein